jgi:cysteine desulfurase
MIYLDNNATTPLASEVISEMVKSLHYIFGNPSSTHYWGEKAKKTVENARKQLSELIGAKPYEIVFTSGGTESNNMAILGTVLRFTSGHIITSSIEHPSVLNPLKFLGNLGFKVTYLSVDKYGLIHPDVLEKHITKKTVLITMMHSNNETGAIQPISKIGKIAKNRGITFHCDAAQSVGKVPVNVKRLNTDMLTIVSHKFYGPKGIGALYKKIGLKLKPILFGASHEKGLRPGTENVAGIVGRKTQRTSYETASQHPEPVFSEC